MLGINSYCPACWALAAAFPLHDQSMARDISDQSLTVITVWTDSA